MGYEEWLSLLGRPANDRKVVSALAVQGIITPVVFGVDESSTGVDFKMHGISLGFTSEFLLNDGIADLPILATVVMKPLLGKNDKGWTAYTGSLPHGLKASDSKDDVLALLGTPVNLDEDFCSALWVIDGQELGILFTDDWKRIKQVGLSLPGGV